MGKDRTPKVSVIIPSYNHGKFIETAINSVLAQSFQDFEIVISDDASSDDSVEKISKFMDPKIRFHKFKENVGAVYNTNFCINESRGEYIALLNSDDMWESKKLELQVKILDENKDIGVVFTDALFLNEEGSPLNINTFQWADVFNQENRTSGEWLRRFFFQLNCLCHPSMLIRKNIYDKTNLYNPCFRQLPDFAMWIDILKFTSIYIINEKLVRFRIFTKSENTSTDTEINKIRNMNEIFLIMNDFFNNMSIDCFKEGFREFLIDKDISTEEEMLCEQAFIFLKTNNDISHIYKLISIEKLYKLLRNEKTRIILNNKYNFKENDFFEITGNLEIKDFTNKNFTEIVAEGVKRELDSSSKFYKFIKRLIKK